VPKRISLNSRLMAVDDSLLLLFSADVKYADFYLTNPGSLLTAGKVMLPVV